MFGQCWDQLGPASSSDTVCWSQYWPEEELNVNVNVNKFSSVLLGSPTLGYKWTRTWKLSLEYLARGHSPPVLWGRSPLPQHPSCPNREPEDSLKMIMICQLQLCYCLLTGHDDCVRFFLILTKTSNTIERPVVIVNRIEQFRMFLMTELLHVQVQKGLPLHFWRLFLSWSYSEVEAIETGTIQLTGQRNWGFFFEENKGKTFF